MKEEIVSTKYSAHPDVLTMFAKIVKVNQSKLPGPIVWDSFAVEPGDLAKAQEVIDFWYAQGQDITVFTKEYPWLDWVYIPGALDHGMESLEKYEEELFAADNHER